MKLNEKGCRSQGEATNQDYTKLSHVVCEQLDAIPNLFCWVDSSWRVGYLKSSVTRLIEPLRGALLGHNLWECCPALVGTPYELALRRALDEEIPVQVDAPSEGSTASCGVMHAHPYRDGALVYFLKPAASVGEAHRASNLLTSIMELAPAFISYIDREYRYREISKKYESYFGRPSSQILGRQIREVIGESAWQQAAPAIDGAMRGEVTHYQAEFPVPGLGIRTCQGAYIPDIDANGDVQGVVAHITDITEQKLSEKTLRDKDAYYRSIFESPGVANTEADLRTGRILRANRVVCEMLGYTEAELLDGKTFLDITPPDDRARNKKAVAPLMAGEVNHFQIQKRYLHKDGTPIWVETVVTILKGADGQPDRLLGAAHDITARVKAEQALRESEERVRLAVKAAGIGYWSLDPQTQVCTLDETCAHFFHVCQTPSDEDIFARIDPEDRDRVKQTFYDSLSAERPYQAEFRVSNPDGSRRWLKSLGAALKDSSGNVERIYGVNIDISAHKEAEEEREKFVSLVRNSSDFIAICDAAGRLLFLNDAGVAMGGFREAGEAVNSSIWDLFFEEERDFLRREVFEGAIVSGREEIETRMRDMKSSEARWVMLTIFPVSASAGFQVGLAVMGRDITLRKHTEQVLLETDRRKDVFLATLAHELRNPLAAISNAVEVWPRLQLDQARITYLRSMVQEQVQQLKRLIDDLLDVSRISQGKVYLRPERLDLARVVQGAIESNRQSVEAAGHDLRADLPVEALFVDGDRARLNQIFGNLIHNAAKYTKGAGRIQISATEQGAFTEIRIRDSGIGIQQDMLERIFEPFTQVHADREYTQGGIAIGLALVKNLVMLHGGTIEAFSDGIDKGSEFVVRLPGVVGEGVARERTDSLIGEEAHLRSLPRNRVLIVDDQNALADSLAMMLEDLGQETRVACDGASALKLVESFQPNFVFSDIAMPGMDGFQLAREMRVRPGPQAKMVAVTGYGQEHDRQRVQRAGFDFHLVKPTSIQAVREVLCAEHALQTL